RPVLIGPIEKAISNHEEQDRQRRVAVGSRAGEVAGGGVSVRSMDCGCRGRTMRALRGLLLLLLLGGRLAVGDDRSYELAANLQTAGIAADSEGLAAYYRSLLPSAERSRRIAQL